MGAGTNTGVVIFVFTFYLFIFAMMGEIQTSMDTSGVGTSQLDQPAVPATPSFGLFDALSGILSFIWGAVTLILQGMLFTITGIPFLFTTMIFTPLAIALLYIGTSLVRGSS